MKKFLARALILVMALALLTACDAGGDTSNPAGNTPGSNSSSGNGNSTPSASNNGGSENVSTPGNSGAAGLPPDTTRMVIGETLEDQGIVVTLDEIWLSTYHAESFSPPPEDHIFIYPHLTITNRDYDGVLKDRMEFSSMGCYVWIDEDKYSFSFDALYSYEGDTKTLDKTPVVKQGDTVIGMTGYIVPENWEKLTLNVSHMYSAFSPSVAPDLNINFEIANPDYDPIRGEREKAARAAERAFRAQGDPSLPQVTLNKGEEMVYDAVTIKFVGYEVFDMRNVADLYASQSFDPSEAYHMILSYLISCPSGRKLEYSIMDMSINESLYRELPFRALDVYDPDSNVSNFNYPLKFDKDEKIELDPTTIETVRFHIIVFDASKGSSDYMENPLYEGYIVFNTPQ